MASDQLLRDAQGKSHISMEDFAIADEVEHKAPCWRASPNVVPTAIQETSATSLHYRVASESGDSHASERICRPKNLPITTDDMETELGRLRDTDIDDDSPVIRSKDRRRKLTDEWRPDRINHQLHRRHL